MDGNAMTQRYGKSPLVLLLLPRLSWLACAQTPPSKTVQERLGYPSTARLLVIHADDLGMSHSVNRASFEALEKGWITFPGLLRASPRFPELARPATAA